MRKDKIITAQVYAQINQTNNSLYYCVSCLNKSYSNFMDLVKAIRELAEESGKLEFNFRFDSTDRLEVTFWKKGKPGSYVTDNTLWRERPLTETEKEQFGQAFILLSE